MWSQQLVGSEVGVREAGRGWVDIQHRHFQEATGEERDTEARGHGPQV